MSDDRKLGDLTVSEFFEVLDGREVAPVSGGASQVVEDGKLYGVEFDFKQKALDFSARPRRFPHDITGQYTQAQLAAYPTRVLFLSGDRNPGITNTEEEREILIRAADRTVAENPAWFDRVRAGDYFLQEARTVDGRLIPNTLLIPPLNYQSARHGGARPLAWVYDQCTKWAIWQYNQAQNKDRAEELLKFEDEQRELARKEAESIIP